MILVSVFLHLARRGHLLFQDVLRRRCCFFHEGGVVDVVLRVDEPWSVLTLSFWSRDQVT